MRYNFLSIILVLAMAFVATGCAQKEPQCPCGRVHIWAAPEHFWGWKMVEMYKKNPEKWDKLLVEQQKEVLAKQKALQEKKLKLSVPVVVLFEKSCFWADNGYSLTNALAKIPENGDVRLLVKEENVTAATEDMKHNGYSLRKNEVYLTAESGTVFHRLTFHKVKAMK